MSFILNVPHLCQDWSFQSNDQHSSHDTFCNEERFTLKPPKKYVFSSCVYTSVLQAPSGKFCEVPAGIASQILVPGLKQAMTLLHRLNP